MSDEVPDLRPSEVEDPQIHFFSNGSEGRAWSSIWCEHCAADHHMHNELDPDYGNGCEIMLRALIHEPIPEWTDRTAAKGFTMPPSIICSGFKQCEDAYCVELDRSLGTRGGEFHSQWAARLRAEMAS